MSAEAGKEVKKHAPHGCTPKVSRNVGSDRTIFIFFIRAIRVIRGPF
jgi:hypothetical protein